MGYSENIAQRIRVSLEHLTNVKEKKMFGSLAFMVKGKICLTAGPKRMMCRIDPKLHEQEVKKKRMFNCCDERTELQRLHTRPRRKLETRK